MKRNNLFLLSDVAGEHILVPVGKAVTNFDGIVSLNDMGVVIWNMLENDMTEDELVEAILSEYDVSAEKARSDIEKFIATLNQVGCLE